MTELNDYDLPLDRVGEAALGWISEALELRHGEAGDPKGSIRGWGSADDSIPEVQDLLLRVRQRSDRVDELLAKATQAKARARRAKDAAAFAAERKTDESVSKRATHRQQFSAASERLSDARLDTFEERRVLHQADRLVSATAEAYDVINQVHWQLDAIRKDLRAILHALQFESSLER